MQPSDLTPEEKEYWTRIETVIASLLDELKAGGWLRKETEWDKTAFGQLLKITNRFNGHMATATALSFAFETKRKEITKSLVELGVGFTAQNVATTWVYDVFGVFTETTELLKNYFLVLLRMDGKVFKSDMTLGWLARSIKQECPINGSKFVNEINIDLRNAFSHGLYWFDKDGSGNDVLCYTDELGTNPHTITQIIDVVKKQHLLSTCFTELLGEKATKDYFK